MLGDVDCGYGVATLPEGLYAFRSHWLVDRVRVVFLIVTVLVVRQRCAQSLGLVVALQVLSLLPRHSSHLCGDSLLVSSELAVALILTL